MQPKNQGDHVSHLHELVKEIQFTMMTTISKEDGSLRSRPMTLQQTGFDGNFWFFVGKSSSIVGDLLENMRVNLAFASLTTSAYVSVSGIGFLVEDRMKASELWSPALKAWFPNGLADADLALLRVHVESADYWESPAGKVVQLAGFAKAIITGKPAGPELGDRGHVEMAG